jgi:hypothetical protein
MTVFKTKNIIDGVDFFKVMDSLNCKLKEVDVFDCENGTLFHYLSQSNQSNYIQIIKLLDIQLGTPSILKRMVALTTLELTYKDNMVDISLIDHLNGCPPSIKSLSIACTRLLVDASNAQVSPIQELEIKCSKFITSLDEVITSCFPELKRLLMTGEIPHRMNITFCSPSFRFACFHPTNSTPFNFNVTRSKNSQPQHYRYNPHDLKYPYCLRTLTVVSPTQKKLTARQENGSLIVTAESFCAE